METITIDGVDEHEFRHSVEDLLRFNNIDEALERLRTLLAPYVGGGDAILPARFLEVTADDVEITGWDRLADRLAHHGRGRFPITAIGVALADARVLGGPGPRDGRLTPFLKTFYFSDDAYPFTEMSRDDLLDGYSREGFGWQGDYQATDATLGIKGLDDLHGAIIALEDRLFDKPAPSEDELRAGTIGACYVAALIHQALRNTIRRRGLPRPLCVLAACDGVYPFFDAPVAGWDDCTPEPAAEIPADIWPNELEDGAVAGEEERGGDRAGEGSLLDLPTVRGLKRLALAIGEEDAAEALRFTLDASAQRLSAQDETKLRGLLHGLPAAPLITPEGESEHAPGMAEIRDEPETDPAPPPPEAAAARPPDVPAYEDLVPDAREQFRRAEEANAFPTGRSLRQRFQPAEAAPASTASGGIARAARATATGLQRHCKAIASGCKRIANTAGRALVRPVRKAAATATGLNRRTRNLLSAMTRRRG